MSIDICFFFFLQLLLLYLEEEVTYLKTVKRQRLSSMHPFSPAPCSTAPVPFFSTYHVTELLLLQHTLRYSNHPFVWH